MTPTDVLHAAGKYTIWDTGAARLGVEILADKAACPPDQFVSKAITDVVDRLCHAIIKSLLLHDGYPANSVQSWKQLVQDKALTTGSDDILQFRTTIRYPIIALGAPVGSYFPAVAEKLGAELIIPEHSEVANAVGAASGHVTEKINVLIRSEAKGSVVLHGPWGRRVFPSISSAQEYAVAAGSRWVEEAAGRAGAENISVVTTTEEFNLKPADRSEAAFHVETRIKIVAVGRPNWRRK
jgi:N-methylhydantoinase A/oxoprolinase/acetone carboxylase beta subunit